MRVLHWGSLLLSMLALPWAATAQETRMVPASEAQLTLSYSAIVKKTAPAVVNIYTKRTVKVQSSASPLMDDPIFRQFFGDRMPQGQERERVVGSLGSGVIISPDGTIVTSNHVIKDADEVKVALPDRREFEAKVFKADPQSDLAFLKIDTKEKLPFIDMRDSDTLEVGDVVLALGNPFGVGQTVTHGIISALARTAAGASDFQFFIQTDAAINPGNSGGALVDSNGRLIGINTAIYSTTGASTGVGFAIPSNMVKSVLASKVEKGRVVRAWLGVSVERVTQDIAESLGMGAPRGVIVRSVAKDSPAERAGLKEGDVILSINGNEIYDENGLQYRVGTATLGDTDEITFLRSGNTQTTNVTFIAQPQDRVDALTIKGRNPLSGVTVATLSQALLDQLGVRNIPPQGVLVLGESRSGMISGAVQKGDIILQINGQKVTSAGHLQKLLDGARGQWDILFQRGNSVMTLSVRL